MHYAQQTGQQNSTEALNIPQILGWIRLNNIHLLEWLSQSPDQL